MYLATENTCTLNQFTSLTKIDITTTQKDLGVLFDHLWWQKLFTTLVRPCSNAIFIKKKLLEKFNVEPLNYHHSRINHILKDCLHWNCLHCSIDVYTSNNTV